MDIKEKSSETTDIDSTNTRKLVLFNSNHLWDDVVNQLMKATGFDILHCEQIAIIAHTKGRAVVKSGDYDELARIDGVLKEISLVTKIE